MYTQFETPLFQISCSKFLDLGLRSGQKGDCIYIALFEGGLIFPIGSPPFGGSGDFLLTFGGSLSKSMFVDAHDGIRHEHQSGLAWLKKASA